MSRPFGRGLCTALCFVALQASGHGGLHKGPWLMHPRTDGITLMVEREDPGPLRVELHPANDLSSVPIVRTDEAMHSLHEISLVGLVPGTVYQYTVSGAGITPRTGHFQTAPLHFAPFRFVVFGDTRSNAWTHANIVAAVRTEGAAFTIHTGDLLADGRKEELWQRFFEIERELLVNTPIVPVIGNHEIVSPAANGAAHFRHYMHVDTSSEPDPELNYTVRFGSVRVVALNAYTDWTVPAHREWLQHHLADLRKEVADGFVIVAMHWGPCSSSLHGENRHIRAVGLDAILRAQHVDLVLSGHDHVFERGEDDGLRYLVSGGGGAPLYPQRKAKPYTRFFARAFHYLRADVESDHILFTAVRVDGTVLHQCSLGHAGWRCDQASKTPAVETVVSDAAIATPSTAPIPSPLPSGHEVAQHTQCSVVTLAHGRAKIPTLALTTLTLVSAGFLARRRRRSELMEAP